MVVNVILQRKKSKENKAFVVKTAGGAASQCLGLMAAILISKQIGRPFMIRHFPYSTGGYYPLAIGPLLHEGEILDSEVSTRGLTPQENLVVGRIIEDHPLLKKGFTYEKFLNVLRKLKLETVGKRIRGEFYLNYSIARLYRVSKSINSVSGGYFPFVDKYVNDEMDSRFIRAGLKSPFSSFPEAQMQNRVVIHYRIGDKRTTYSHPGIMGDGIVNPLSFKNILEGEGSTEKREIFVISDEPDVAQGLLEEVGIKAHKNPETGNLWNDLFLMSTAGIVICPWSTVSQFALTFLVSSGKKVYYPSSTSNGWGGKWNISGVTLYDATYLPREHHIYHSDYPNSSNSHTIYNHENRNDQS
jgi:hypothetical protein